MHTGMLWFDNNPKLALDQKILNAALYYRRKYDRAPEICLINPVIAAAHPQVTCIPFEGGTITVRAWRGTLSHHFWVGREEEPVEVVS